MRQDLADFRGHKRPLPMSMKSRMRNSGGFCSVVQENGANVIRERGLPRNYQRFEVPHQTRQRKLSPEDETSVEWGAAPNQHIKLVIHKTSQRAFIGIPDQLPELRLGCGYFRDLLLLDFILSVRGRPLLRNHVSRLKFA